MADIIYTYKNEVYANITNKCDCACTFCIRSQKDAIGDATSLWHTVDPTYDEIIAAICTLVKKKLPDYVGAGINEIQILTPSKKSATGSLRLNKIMQEYLNPPQAGKQEKVYGEVTFREGDKVMQIKNNYQTEWEKKRAAELLLRQSFGFLKKFLKRTTWQTTRPIFLRKRFRRQTGKF